MDRTRRNILTVSLFAEILLGAQSSRAQFSTSFQTNLISAVTSNWTGDYFVGSNTVSDVLLIQSGGVLSNHIGYVGYLSNDVNNVANINGTGSAWLNQASVIIGYFGSGNSLIISNGALVTCSPSPFNGAGYLGYNSSSTGNTVLVSGTGSIWSNKLDLAVGFGGGGNSLVISNGGLVLDRTANVGGSITSTNNSVLVTGSGSVWSNSGGLFFGQISAGNSLAIRNGGCVSDNGGTIGTSGNVGTNNTVLVADPGSVWSNTTTLTIGYGSGDNSLVISNGGQVVDINSRLGADGNSSSNTVIVTGTGSVWNNSGTLTITPAKGHLNGVVISSGAKVLSAFGIIASFSNSVLVTGAGSVWSNNNDLSVGTFDTANTLLITNNAQVVVNRLGVIGNGIGSKNQVGVIDGGVWRSSALIVGSQGLSNSLVIAGGSVFATNLVIGAASATCDNFVELDSGSLFVTNATHDAVLEVRHGQFILNGGVLQVDKLVMTNSCGLFVRGGGTLIIGTLVLDPALDADGDGIPNGWEQQYGLDPLNAADTNSDSDGDGFSNLQEFLAGTDPTDAASLFKITSIAAEGNNLRVTWTTAVGRTNALQAANSGAGGLYNTNNYADIFTVTNAASTTTNYLDSGATTNFPARFYRVRLIP